MEKEEGFLKRHGVRITMGIMFCILIFLGGMLFSINSKLINFQTRMEKRISELEKRQNSIEESLSIYKNIQPGLEGIHESWEAFKEKMGALEGAVEKFVDELSESLSKEQKEKMEKAINKLFRLWEAFGEFVEEMEAENREMREGKQGEGRKN
jgi:chromosome segregation ATPase